MQKAGFLTTRLMCSKFSPTEQWSPINPEGKKHYDREFLLQFQLAPEAVVKPPGLPEIPDIILDKVGVRWFLKVIIVSAVVKPPGLPEIPDIIFYRDEKVPD